MWVSAILAWLVLKFSLLLNTNKQTSFWYNGHLLHSKASALFSARKKGYLQPPLNTRQSFQGYRCTLKKLMEKVILKETISFPSNWRIYISRLSMLEFSISSVFLPKVQNPIKKNNRRKYAIYAVLLIPGEPKKPIRLYLFKKWKSFKEKNIWIG